MAVSQSSSDSDASQEQDASAADGGGERPQSVRSLDFSQPPKFTTEIKRRILGALEPFAEGLSAWLANELGSEVKLDVTDLTQRSWAEAIAQLPAASVAVAVEAPSIERQMLLSAERPLLLQALECLLGGNAATAPAERHLTELDWTLAKGILQAAVQELSSGWEEIEGPRLSLGDVDVVGDGGVLVPVGEPTLCAALASKIDGQDSSLSLLIPWSAVEPFAESLRAGPGGNHAVPATAMLDQPRALRRGVAGAQVLLRAEVSSLQMPVRRMLELLPGQLVEFGGRAEDGVCLFAEGVSLGRGRPGRSGTRRAIKLQSTIEPPIRADMYAKLGRAELERARASVEAAREGPDGGAILHSIFVRVWAELGRTHLPLGAALELGAGAVVELDQSAEAPVELFANGLCFANGSLVVSGEGAWGVQIAELV